MKILEIKPLALPEIRVLRVQRFVDSRGYFLEVYRSDVMTTVPELPELQNKPLSQINESSSAKNVIRGLHTQSQPNLDKLLRVLQGKIIDVAVDIRIDSPTFGQTTAYELSYDPSQDYEELIFIPFGFAHGIVALEDSHIQYFQTGYWSAAGEATVNFADPEIDWSRCEPAMQQTIKAAMGQALISDKDKAGVSLAEWKTHPLAVNYHINVT